MKLKYLYSVIILISFTASCQNKKPTAISPEEKAQQALEAYNRPNEIWPTNKDKNGDYYYGVNMGSIKGNLAVNAGSYFTTGKEEVHFGPRDLGKDWGDGTGSFVMNDEYHPIPKTLFAQWFSISENKFYAGSFDMPTAVIQKYFDEMWLTFESYKISAEAYKHERFTNIIVGVAPSGVVVVWISSQSQQIEIGRYQAKETQMEWEDFKGLNGMGSGSTKENYLSYYKNQLPVPYGKADKYRVKFNWRPKIEYENKAINPDLIKPTKYRIEYYDGTCESLYKDFGIKNSTKLRPIPKRIIFEFVLLDRNYGGGFDLSELDIFKAFYTLCKDLNTSVQLTIKLGENNKISKIILKNSINEYVLDCNDVQLGSISYDGKTQPLNEE